MLITILIYLFGAIWVQRFPFLCTSVSLQRSANKGYRAKEHQETQVMHLVTKGSANVDGVKDTEPKQKAKKIGVRPFQNENVGKKI